MTHTTPVLLLRVRYIIPRKSKCPFLSAACNTHMKYNQPQISFVPEYAVQINIRYFNRGKLYKEEAV